MKDSPRCRWLLALALFLAIWGARLSVIERFGSDLPFWDQWDKEADKLYAGWIEQGEARHLFLPHNEHRIVPTLTLNLGLVLASGQWDARVQSAISAALNAAILAGLFLWISGQVARGWALACAVVVAAIGVAPIPWENVVSGFQTQFYFLIGFSLLAIGGLLSPAFSPRWWGGGIAAGLALVSMGSGLLCVAPVALVVAARWLAGTATRRDTVATLAMVAAVGAAGLALHTRVAYHDVLHAHTLGAFVKYALHCLAWPLPQHPWLGAILWLPWAAFATARLLAWKRGNRDDTPDLAGDFVLAMGLWALAQIAAASYSRGGTGEFPASRYGDVLALGFIASFFSLAAGAARWRWMPLLAGSWLVPAGICLVLATLEVWRGPLPAKKAELVASEQNVRAFVLTGAFPSTERGAVPFPSADELARILRRPAVRALLPASVRAPLPAEGLSLSAITPAPPLTHRPIHAQLAPGEWRSGPLPGGEGWWIFETAGQLDRPGSTLELISAADGRVLAAIRPSKPPGNSWRAAYVPAPEEPAVIRARTADAAHWLAVSEPVEMSGLSYRTWRLVQHSRWLVAVGAGMAFLAGAGCLRRTALKLPGTPQASRSR